MFGNVDENPFDSSTLIRRVFAFKGNRVEKLRKIIRKSALQLIGAVMQEEHFYRFK